MQKQEFKCFLRVQELRGVYSMRFLYFILDKDRFGEDYLSVARKAAPHVSAIWFRIKNVPDLQIYNEALALRKALPDMKLILSERADIAVCASFNGVHLNSTTVPPEKIKETFPDLLTGYSAHSAEECLEIKADYYTLSPVFETQKAYEVKPLGPVPAPVANVFALGGINSDNVHKLARLGYAGVAGVSLISDIENISAKIKEQI